MPTLKLDCMLYPRAALDEAATAFAELATIEIRANGRHQRIRFSDVAASAADRIADEFANFALVRTVERARREGGR